MVFFDWHALIFIFFYHFAEIFKIMNFPLNLRQGKVGCCVIGKLFPSQLWSEVGSAVKGKATNPAKTNTFHEPWVALLISVILVRQLKQTSVFVSKSPDSLDLIHESTTAWICYLITSLQELHYRTLGQRMTKLQVVVVEKETSFSFWGDILH